MTAKARSAGRCGNRTSRIDKDFGKTFLTTANGATPYYAAENTETQYEFVRNASKVTANRYFSLVSTFGGARGYRKQLNLNQFFTTVSHIPDYIAEKSKATIYTQNGGKNGNELSVYADEVATLLKAEKENVVKNWESWKASAGLK